MTDDNEFEVGKEILSYCGKCKEPTKHTIINLNKKGGADKCQCLTCKAKHKYRDPDKPVPVSRAKKETISAKAVWEEAMKAAKGDFVPYKMNGSFAEGAQLDHSTFGQGVVTEVVGASKIKVAFEDGEKLLVHNR